MATPHEQHALAAMSVAFTKLPQWAQIGTIMIALISFGATGALIFSDLSSLAPRVAQLELSDVANDSLHRDLNLRISMIESDARIDRDRIEAKIDRLLCFNEADRGEHGYELCIE